MAAAALDVEIGGRALHLTSLHREVYPRAHFTKRDLLAYYAAIAPAMLPHLRGHAVEVRRYPHGIAAGGGGGHWLRDIPPWAPAWIEAAPVHAETRGGDIRYPHIVDEATLLWCANQNMIEYHVLLARFERPSVPEWLVFDLDPGTGRDAADCADVALVIRDTLEREAIRLFPKSSGSKGIQLYAPLRDPDATFSRTKSFAREIAEAFAHLDPERITASVLKERRKRKVLIDWGQNERNHLMVAPYSLRARDEPVVSAPLAWREVEEIAATRDTSIARVGPQQAIARVEELGDLFAPVLTMEQRLRELG